MRFVATYRGKTIKKNAKIRSIKGSFNEATYIGVSSLHRINVKINGTLLTVPATEYGITIS
jgi:hypothetical protein